MTRLKATAEVTYRPTSKAGRAARAACAMMAAEPARKFSAAEIAERARLRRAEVYSALTADPAQFARVGTGKFQLRKEGHHACRN